MSHHAAATPAFDEHAVPGPAQPWWRFGIVWLVVGGPAAVVVAAVATAIIAINGADPVIGGESMKGHRIDALTPAGAARNHAATPAAPAELKPAR
jgi:uncharacterized protein